jgi:hypothetical protein
MKADQDLKYCESILIDKLIIKNLVRARPRESPLSRGWKWCYSYASSGDCPTRFVRRILSVSPHTGLARKIVPDDFLPNWPPLNIFVGIYWGQTFMKYPG